MKRLMKGLLGLAVVVLLIGCDGAWNNYGYDVADEDDTVDDGTESYLSNEDYQVLLDALEGRSNITRSVIDEELTALNVSRGYDYSYYDSTYNAHTLNWSEYSSYTYDWIYYVEVDIWVTEDGTLQRDMCSYYEG